MLKPIEKKCIRASVLNGSIDFAILKPEQKAFAVGIFVAAINQGKISDDMFSDEQKKEVTDMLAFLSKEDLE